MDFAMLTETHMRDYIFDGWALLMNALLRLPLSFCPKEPILLIIFFQHYMALPLQR